VLAYASERDVTLEAEATIAEHKYRQALISARNYRLDMVGAQARHVKIKDDIQRFHGFVQNRIPVINTGSKGNHDLGLNCHSGITVLLEPYWMLSFANVDYCKNASPRT
jgi:hypothetical protein